MSILLSIKQDIIKAENKLVDFRKEHRLGTLFDAYGKIMYAQGKLDATEGKLPYKIDFNRAKDDCNKVMESVIDSMTLIKNCVV